MIKIPTICYSELPHHQSPMVPWRELHADSIGLWNFTEQNQDIKLCALTIIDPVSALLEIDLVRQIDYFHIAQKFEN